MCDKAIVKNAGTLKCVPNCYKNKAVENYPHELEYVLECYKTEKCVIKLLIIIHLQ